LCSRPSLRVVEGIEQLAALIHPECFPVEFARDALQLQLHEDEDVPAQADFPLRCAPLYTGGSADLRTDSLRSSAWLMVNISGKPFQSAVSMVPGIAEHDDALFLPGSHLTKDVWYGSIASDTSCKWSQQKCEVIVGESVPTSRACFAGTLWGDILLVFGGVSRDTGLPLARLELLHLRTHCWTHGSTTGALPPPRSGLTIVIDQASSRMVVFGGWDGSGHLSDLHFLDLQKWHWECVDLPGPTPSPRSNHAACAWRGEGMVIHGGSTDQGDLSDVWLLHWNGPPSSWWWEAVGGLSNVPQERTKHAAIGFGDNILIAGGERSNVLLADVHVLNIRSRQWRALPSLPHGTVCRQGLTLLDSGVVVKTHRNDKRDDWDLYLLPHHVLWNICGNESVAVQTPVMPEEQNSGNVYSWDASQPLSLQEVHDKAAAGDQKTRKAISNIEKLPEERKPQATWAMLNRVATTLGREQYVDPATGYLVFTTTFLRKRPCCGNRCRHCPYGHVNVPEAGLAAVSQDW